MLWLSVALLGCQEQGVTKVNNGPEAVITSHEDGDEVGALGTVNLRGSVSDADNGPDELLASWFADGVVVCDDLVPEDDGSVACAIEVGTDPVQVGLEVHDPSNATGVASITLVPGDAGNQAPTVVIVDPSAGEAFDAGDPVLFQATVTDNVDAPEALELVWSSSLDGELSTDPATGAGIAAFTTSTLSIGTHVVSLGATDSDGFYGTANVTIDVVDCVNDWYLDLDEDGYGDPATQVLQCDEPPGYVANDDDCDDLNPYVSPAAGEVCDDGVDNDCDAAVDEGCLGTNCFEDDHVVADHRYFQYGEALEITDAESGVGFFRDDFEIDAVAGEELAFHMWSADFDTHLELYDPDCALYDQYGSGARGTNALLQVRIPSDGIWTIVATSGASGLTGDYVFEAIDDSVSVGLNCALDTDTLDILTSPYADSFSGSLQNSDSDFGGGFYYDDIEFYSFYGDNVVIDETSAAFDPILSLFGPDCTLVTYDEDGGDGNNARVTTTTERTGIYTAAPWAEYSNSTGAYTVAIEASW